MGDQGPRGRPPGGGAGSDIAAGARAFSQRARAAVDAKLTFGATLVRAGEIVAAARVIDELEQDVRAETAILLGLLAPASDDHATSK